MTLGIASRTWMAGVAAAALFVSAPVMAQDEGDGEEKEGAKTEVHIDGLAAGQYVHHTGDGHKLLEDEGNHFLGGFVLEHFLLESVFEDGKILEMGTGFFVPETPRWADGYLFARLRDPALWSIQVDVARAVYHDDDSIGSSSSTLGLYPSVSLGRHVVAEKLDLALGFTVTPCTCSKIGVKAKYSNVYGWTVPLEGSRADTPTGPVFEYPAVMNHGDHDVTVLLDGTWRKGGLGLSVLAGYRYISIDSLLKAYRPPSYDDIDTYPRSRVLHTVFARLGLTMDLSDWFTLTGNYAVSWTQSNPGATADSVLTVHSTEKRVEHAPGAESSVVGQSLSAGLLFIPTDGLGLRLYLTGSLASGKGSRSSETFLGDTSTLVASNDLRSGLDRKGFEEQFVLTFSRVSWLDVKIRQGFELEHRDVFRVLFDTLDDGVDETRAEDTAYTTIENTVEALVKFHLAKGLFLKIGGSYRNTRITESEEDLIDWIPFGDSQSYMADARLGLTYRMGQKLSVWAQGRFFSGQRFRPWVTDLEPDYRYELMGFVAEGGLRAMPLSWLFFYASYSYTHGDYEVASAPLLGAWGPIVYRGRTHALTAGVSLSPLSWLGLDAGYQLALVDGSLESMIHRINFDSRFKVHDNVTLGVGYLGRIYSDDLYPQDDYGAHAIRLLISGTF